MSSNLNVRSMTGLSAPLSRPLRTNFTAAFRRVSSPVVSQMLCPLMTGTLAIIARVRFRDGAYFEVVRPSAQRAVQLAHQLCGLLPSPRSGRQRVDVLDHALDALLRWPVPQIRLSGSR